MKIAIYFRKLSPGQLRQAVLLKEKLCVEGAGVYEYGRDFTGWRDLPSDTSLFLSLGGDGTYLESVMMVRDRQIPVAGINFGRLGFLTAARVDDDTFPWVADLVKGRYSVEHRDILKLTADVVPDGFHPYACNEIALQRRGTGMLSIKVKVDGMEIPTYWSDGIVIATATGSTAYNMSVGGPIVFPTSKVLIVSPISPHNLNVRPLVFPCESVFDISFDSRGEDALLSLDNRSFSLSPGCRFRVSLGEYGFNHVSLSRDGFISALKNKLLWGEDIRNNK